MVGTGTRSVISKIPSRESVTKRIIVSVPARIDLNRHYDYIAQGNPEAALQFFDAARQTFGDLARMSGMGSSYISPNARLKNLQKWRVKGFRAFLIFYRTQKDTIEILRILSAAQDIEEIIKNM
jgi:toxin ParE1/3/4